MSKSKFAGLVAFGLVSTNAYAAGAVAFIDYYHIILHAIGLDEAAISTWAPTAGALMSLGVVLTLGILFKSSVDRDGDNLVPHGRFSVRNLVEMLMEFVYNLARDTIGKGFKGYLPLLSAIFVFVLISNLSGLIPGFPPTTENINTNMAIGIMVFLVYNFAGIKEHGFSYIKQFLGPVAFIAPLMLVIELISHLARPFSLSIRLLGNLFGDHLMLSVFTGLTYVGIPAALLFFGLLVACVQSFVFTLLTSIYVSMAVSHDH